MSKKIEKHILERYRVGELIGSGAYGHVWRVQDKLSGKTYALKKVFGAFRNNIDAQRTYRQVQILQRIKHPNVITLHRVLGAANKQDLYLVFELMEADLLAVVGSAILSPSHQIYLLYQLLNAVEHLHTLRLIHRDLKPSNILLDSHCALKVCDFGLVRSLAQAEHEHPVLSEEVATKWYRAPELLLGSRTYSYPADMWSVGCIAAELLLGRPLFQGKSVLEQLEKIVQFAGPVTKSDLESLDSPVVECLLSQIRPKHKQFSDYFSLVAKEFHPLLQGLLKFNPNERLTAGQALSLDLFRDFQPERQHGKNLNFKAIVPQLDDNHRFNLKQYRRQIYSSIPKQLRAPSDKKHSVADGREKLGDKSLVKDLKRMSKTLQVQNKKREGGLQSQGILRKNVVKSAEKKSACLHVFSKLKKQHYNSCENVFKNKGKVYKQQIEKQQGCRYVKSNVLERFDKKLPVIKKQSKKLKVFNK